MNSKYIIGLFIILGLVIWGNTLTNTLLWDDDDNIVNNVYIKDFKYLPNLFTQNQIAGAGFTSNQYRPILLLTYAFEYHFVGLNPLFYHLNNVIIHVFNSILVFYFIKKLTSIGNWKLEIRNLTALLTSLLFLIHPVQTEAVAYIAGRTDLLATTFLLLGLLVYLSSWPKPLRVILISLAYCGAILSKESSIMFPALIFLLYILKRKPQLDQVTIQFPLLIIGVSYTVLRLTTLNFQNTINFYTSSNIFTESVFVRLYTFLSVLPQYITLFLLPTNLHPERTIAISTAFVSRGTLMGFFICILSAAAIIYYWKKSPFVIFGILWFFITIFLSSNILIPVNALITEHWLYTPSIGFFLIIGLTLNWIIKRQKTTIVLLAVLVLPLCLKTIMQNTIWHDQISLYEHILRYNPKSARVHNNLGMAYENNKLPQKAIVEYKKAIKLQDVYPQTHHNLANALKNQGNESEAIDEYKKALQIDPKFIFSYKPLIKLLEKNNRTKEAQELINRVQ